MEKLNNILKQLDTGDSTSEAEKISELIKVKRNLTLKIPNDFKLSIISTGEHATQPAHNRFVHRLKDAIAEDLRSQRPRS